MRGSVSDRASSRGNRIHDIDPRRRARKQEDACYIHPLKRSTPRLLQRFSRFDRPNLYQPCIGR